MKQYTGKLNPITARKVKDNQALLKQLAAPRYGLGRPASLTTTIEETIAKYNAGITEDEIKCWVWYRKSLGIPMTAWKKYHVEMTPQLKERMVKKGYLFLEPTSGNLVPFPVYVFGNLYEKLGKLPKHEDTIVFSYGQSVYDNHVAVLEKHKPKPISIQNPVESERPVILAISEQAKNTMLSTLRQDTGVILTEPTDMQDAFKTWLREQPQETLKGASAYEIIAYYLNNERKPRSLSKEEWANIKKKTRDEGERQFKIFLHTALETTDQLKIDAQYNSMYNATAPLQYQKIPIGIEVSRYFMGFELDIRPAQREGIAFMELVGSGIVAYDVGVGKTITAIIETASAIKNGKCKRPLVVVPNPTYKNWIKELKGEGKLQGILTGTGIEVNEWYNLGADYDDVDLLNEVPENSITLVTYEGFNKIGFNEHTQQEHFSELARIVGQNDGDMTDRAQEKENEKLREIIGVGLKETIADIEDLGFDYVVIDEAHNFKNVFSEVKSDKDGNKQFHIKGGQPSNRAIKAFFLCNYIQRKYGRNVMLLTATPFTNSPLEIYSMLSLVAYEYMVKNNILNLRQFFEQYIQETSEPVVGLDGKITQKDVVKSFNNRISLQKLINSHINFKTGEEANIPRPCKINLPKTTAETENGLVKLQPDQQILTYLSLTTEQKENQQAINASAAQGASRDDPGRLLRLMSESLNNALSPFLYNKTAPANYVDFVESSPKVLYTMQCIRSVKQWHELRNEEVSGQVIYIDRGKEYFKYIKQYLEKELGYKKGVALKSNPKQKVDEVEFVVGGMPASKKEKIKDAFNEGVCKIIIGTSTIKEGINLQKKSTVLYNLYPNWNPTDIRQLEGRIWRQKNEFGYVRIVMPLMENSMDVFVFQKLDEKTARINDLWSKSDRGNVLDEESLDPNEVKFALVTDLNVLLEFELKQQREELYNNKTIVENQLKDLTTYEETKRNYESSKNKVIDKLNAVQEKMQGAIVYQNEQTYQRIYLRDIPTIDVEKDLPKYAQEKLESINTLNEMLAEVVQGNLEDKHLIQTYALYKRINNDRWSYDWDYDRFKDTTSKLGKIQRTLFKNRGYDENTNIEKIKLDLQEELDQVTLEIKQIQSAEYQQKVYEKIAEEKRRLSIKGGSLDSRVEDFSSLNHLLSYKFSDIDHHSCEIPVIELKPKQDDNKEKRKRLAIAKAKAAAVKLKLLAA